MKWLTDVLDETDIEYVEDGWAPLRPPQNEPCIVFHDEVEVDGCDESVMWSVHSVSVDLYDNGGSVGRAARKKVADCLKQANLKFERYEPTYIYSEKKYMTSFMLADYIEKE